MSVPSVPIVDLTYAQMADEVRALAFAFIHSATDRSRSHSFTAQERYSLPAAAGYGPPPYAPPQVRLSAYKSMAELMDPTGLSA